MKRRPITFILAAAILIVSLTYLTVTPSPIPGDFPAHISTAEKQQIASAIDRDRYARCVRYLKDGQFRATWQWLKRSRDQRIWDVGDQPDGAIWVHLGNVDTSNRKGYSLTIRYIVKKEAGKWKIVGSDF